MRHSEKHRQQHIGWLRAAVLGANDGIVSTSSLIIGVATAHADAQQILVSGTAGLVAGALSMAAGEYVSVSSQVDTEQADLKREQHELIHNQPAEVQELAAIYVGRGVDPDLAERVAMQMMSHDALTAHARDELGLTDVTSARPLQAALTSALTFSAGAVLPLLAVMVAPYVKLDGILQFGDQPIVIPGAPVTVIVGLVSLVALMTLGGIAAFTGRSPVLTAISRVTSWGVLSMGLTAAVGLLFGTSAV